MKTENFTVPKIACEGCVETVKGALQRIYGVRDVKVDIKTKKVEVGAEENVEKKSLISALKEAGYPPKE
ncbi:MAG: heavy-metal-associated domain-containing protein [Firmicutes bacterium]|nr:heavy-metal-associated domain-containing protein [Bacillota bacterium]